MRQSVRHLPVGMYGAVMGLAGLGLACRSAAGVVPLPAFFAEIWVVLGAASLALLVPAYLAKLARHPEAVREEFLHPAQLGFCGALPVGMTLVAGGLAPYAPAAGAVLWWAGAALLFLFQVWALRVFLAGDIPIAEVNGGWLIVMVGGIVVPGPAFALGLAGPSAVLFGLSAAVAPIVVALVFYRTVAHPPLPPALRPTWFIFLVPPSLIYAHGLTLFGEFVFLENLFFFATLLAVALLVYARNFLRWPFGATWWAFTFPLDAYAFAAARYAQSHPEPLWKGVAAAALAVATLFVALVLVKTLVALARGELLAPAATPRSAASRAA